MKFILIIKKSLGNVQNFKLKDYIFINKFQRVSLNLRYRFIFIVIEDISY